MANTSWFNRLRSPSIHTLHGQHLLVQPAQVSIHPHPAWPTPPGSTGSGLHPSTPCMANTSWFNRLSSPSIHTLHGQHLLVQPAQFSIHPRLAWPTPPGSTGSVLHPSTPCMANTSWFNRLSSPSIHALH